MMKKFAIVIVVMLIVGTVIGVGTYVGLDKHESIQSAKAEAAIAAAKAERELKTLMTNGDALDEKIKNLEETQVEIIEQRQAIKDSADAFEAEQIRIADKLAEMKKLRRENQALQAKTRNLLETE